MRKTICRIAVAALVSIFLAPGFALADEAILPSTDDPIIGATGSGEPAADPEATNPEDEDLEVTDPEGEDPEDEDPEAIDPEATDPEGEDPEATDPDGEDPEATDPEGEDPEATDPDGEDPEATDPEGEDPEAIDPEATDPDGEDLEGEDAEAIDPEDEDPEAIDPEATDPDGEDLEGEDAESADPEATNPEGEGAEATDPEEDEADPESDETILDGEEVVAADAIEPEAEPKDMQDAASAEATDGLLSPCAPTGWREKDGVRYYIDPITNKRLKGGLFTIDGEQYCFDPKGIIVTGWMVIDEEVYYFDSETGAMVTSCDKIIKGLCAPLAAAGGASFTDVSKKTPHSADVSWTFESGISTGWVEENGTRTFRPMSELARADMAAFLYRLAGSPAFVATKTDAKYFSDVDPDTPHANEIWWLASAGISEGWLEENGTRTFRPYDELARADMAAFLYRIAGSPSYSPSAADREYFTDVEGSTPHAKEIRWLGSVGVSEGWTEDDGTRTFRPLDTIKRQDMAAFLHRMVANEVLEPSAEHEYRFDSDGHVVTGWNSGEFFDPANGARVEAGWAREATRTRYISPSTGSTLKDGVHTIAGYKYIFNTTGNVRHGWIEVDGARRYFSKESGRMLTNGIYKIGNSSYCFASDGTLRTGLVTRGSATYYFDPSTGKMQFGLKTVDGSLYYFDRSTGKAYKNKLFTVDNVIYKADSSGKLTKQLTKYPDMLAKAQGYYSPTGYLILVDCYDNVVCVYREGANGEWVPAREFRCSSGAPGTPTVRGVFSLGAKGYSFSGDGHTCYWYSQIYGDYLFHSILYHEGTFDVLDGRLGMNLSLGCVRLHIDNAKWIYDEVPYGTTVVTYGDYR